MSTYYKNPFWIFFTTFRRLFITLLSSIMYGARIRHFRKLNGLTQADMAEKLNMATATYSKIETGRTHLSADLLKGIADIFGIFPLEILNDDSTEPDPNDSSNNEEKAHGWINADTAFIYQKEIADNLIASKDSEIAFLKQANDTLRQTNKNLQLINKQLISEIKMLKEEGA